MADMGLVIWRECSSLEDTVCRCSPGYFCETQEGDHCSTHHLPSETESPEERYFEFLLQGLRIDMELFMKFFRWQRSLRTEGIEGTGGCINNSIALCQRTSFANSSAPFSISSSAVSASKHSFTRAQIGNTPVESRPSSWAVFKSLPNFLQDALVRDPLTKTMERSDVNRV
ncbi:hypothetical protein STEG23_018718 [Scotinomys teguina]